MYYTNISNKELEPFHDLQVPNFSITLTDLLTSGLFKVETIITSKLYRIYPLFYTGNIASSNPDDKIIEDKCIIANKVGKETTFTFLSNPDEPVQDYVSYGSYYEIDDSLTDAEFNSIISLLLRNTTFTDNISLNNGVVTGVYGEYDFDITSTTIIDTGILITRETLTNLGTVTLKELVFHNATYTMNLTVVHDIDINILEVDDDNTITETLTIELVPDTPVNIPFDTLDYNYVILKDATVTINHDKPIIRGVQTNTIGVTATKNTIQQGDTSTLTFTAYDLNSLPSPNQSIDIYKDNAKITTLTTNQQGQVSYTYTATGDGEHTFKGVQYLVESSDYDLLDCLFYDGGVTGNTNNGFNYNVYVTVTIDDTGTTVTENSEVSGRRYSVLKPDSQIVYDWEGNLIIECEIINGNDNVRIGLKEWQDWGTDDIYRTLTQLGLTNGGHLKITYDGTNVKYYVDDTLTYTSSNVTLTQYGVTFFVPTSSSFKYKDFKIYTADADKPYNLILNSDKSILQPNETATLTATVQNAYGNPMPNETVKFYNGTTLISTETTDNNGECSVSYSSKGVGDINIKAECGLLQKTYSIGDYLFSDKATQANHRTDWTDNDLTVAYSNTGTTLSNSTSTGKYFIANYTMTDECIVEVDLTRYATTNPRLTIKGYTFYLTTARAPMDTEVHIKAVFSSGKVKYYIDDTYIDEYSTTSSTSLAFHISDNGLKFRNLKVYKL